MLCAQQFRIGISHEAVKTSYVQDDGGDGEKLPGRGELHTVVELFPVCEESGFSLVGGLKRSPFNSMHKDVHALWTQTGSSQDRILCHADITGLF